MNKIDKILIIMAVFMVFFVAAVFYVFVKVGSEPSTLIAVVGGAVIAEIIALCKIKVGKQRIELKDKENGQNAC